MSDIVGKWVQHQVVPNDTYQVLDSGLNAEGWSLLVVDKNGVIAYIRNPAAFVIVPAPKPEPNRPSLLSAADDDRPKKPRRPPRMR